MFDIQVIGIKFSKPNQFGDFYWMSKQDEFAGSLFIFNDNEEHHNTNKRGAGNAIMRSFNKYSNNVPPKSAGIPTGTLSYGGYELFDPRTKKQIDDAFDEIIDLIKIHNYHTVYFSSELDGKLGTSIFQVNEKVIRYITFRLYQLTLNPVKIVKVIPTHYFDSDDFDEFDQLDNLSDSDNSANSANSDNL